MKRMISLYISAMIAVTVLIGCAASPPTPTPDQINNADYGPYPNDYKEIITNHYTGTLFDPYSAKIGFGSPKKHWTSSGNSFIFGWAVCGKINAKNRMGGYVGAKDFYALIKNGRLVVIETDEGAWKPPSCPE